MRFRFPNKATSAAFGIAVAMHLAVLPLSLSTSALAANATLPGPYVSRALDAVLIPIDASVRSAFGLGEKETGALVLAVEPGGVADSYGIEPGDVISQIKGHKIVEPIDVDTIVYYWIHAGAFDFVFDYYRGGQVYNAYADITLELYETTIDLTTISSWSSTTVESFNYEEYTAEYSEEITTTYESSETTIEETVTSEAFTSEVTEEATSEDGDFDGDGTVDAEDTDDDNDGVADAEDGDDNGDGIDDTSETTDADDDGTADAFDADDDNDGVDDVEDSDDGDGTDDVAEDDSGGDE